MKYWSSMLSGLAGSMALTALHQTLKENVVAAPRMDKLGRQALSKIISAAAMNMPAKDDLENITLAGDIAGNAAYYSMVGVKPKYALITGAALGLAAGIGAIVLPEKMGLNEKYSNRTRKTRVLTITLYLAGGLVAGGVQMMLNKKGA